MEWSEIVRMASEVAKDLVEIYRKNGINAILEMMLEIERIQRLKEGIWETVRFEIWMGYIDTKPYYVCILEDDEGIIIENVYIFANSLNIDRKTAEKFKQMCDEIWNYFEAP